MDRLPGYQVGGSGAAKGFRSLTLTAAFNIAPRWPQITSRTAKALTKRSTTQSGLTLCRITEGQNARWLEEAFG